MEVSPIPTSSIGKTNFSEALPGENWGHPERDRWAGDGWMMVQTRTEEEEKSKSRLGPALLGVGREKITVILKPTTNPGRVLWPKNKHSNVLAIKSIKTLNPGIKFQIVANKKSFGHWRTRLQMRGRCVRACASVIPEWLHYILHTSCMTTC